MAAPSAVKADAPQNAGSPIVKPIDVATTTDDVAEPEPQRPAEPDAADCCGEGCARCIYDVYEDALERHQAALAAWRARRAESLRKPD